MLIHTLPNFYAQYDKELSLLRLEWIARSDVRNLRASAKLVLQLLQQLQVANLLVDINNAPNIQLANQNWLGDHFLPELAAHPLTQLIMVNEPFRVHNQFAIEALYDSGWPAVHFGLQCFSDTESALDWFTDSSQRLLTLEKEWKTRSANPALRQVVMAAPIQVASYLAPAALTWA